MLNWLTFRLFYFLYFRTLNLKLFQINGTLQKKKDRLSTLRLNLREKLKVATIDC